MEDYNFTKATCSPLITVSVRKGNTKILTTIKARKMAWLGHSHGIKASATPLSKVLLKAGASGDGNAMGSDIIKE